jgi:hypothetical protein
LSHSFSVLDIFEIGLVSNHDPPHLYLLSS